MGTSMAAANQFSISRTEISGVSIADLAKEFGTPTYVYDSAKIVERINDLKKFDVIRYAQKANSNIAILDFMRRHGVVVDAVSVGEIHRAIAAGYSISGEPDPIVYTADIFDKSILEFIKENAIHCNAGSPDMITQLGEVRSGAEITLRINPGFGHGHSQKTNTGGDSSKHGIWHDQVPECIERAKSAGVTISGLHMHIGSGTDFEHLSQVCESMKATALEIGSSINTISAGGGLPTPYKESDEMIDIDRYFELWDATRKELEAQFGHPISLEIEPGRYLSAESGYLIAEIRAIKKMGEKLYYLVDAGFNNLARPIMYGSYHPISISSSNESTEVVNAIVGGPLCESGDIFTQEEGGFVCSRALPTANVGDHLIIECAGAYGFVMSSNYNSKPFAAEVLLHGGKPHLIRQRQTNEDLIRGEFIPDLN
jgi:diaminopimelate decarboxylase